MSEIARRYREMSVAELRREEAIILSSRRTGCLPGTRIRARIDPREAANRLTDVRTVIGRRLSGDA